MSPMRNCYIDVSMQRDSSSRWGVSDRFVAPIKSSTNTSKFCISDGRRSGVSAGTNSGESMTISGIVSLVSLMNELSLSMEESSLDKLSSSHAIDVCWCVFSVSMYVDVVSASSASDMDMSVGASRVSCCIGVVGGSGKCSMGGGGLSISSIGVGMCLSRSGGSRRSSRG